MMLLLFEDCHLSAGRSFRERNRWQEHGLPLAIVLLCRHGRGT